MKLSAFILIFFSCVAFALSGFYLFLSYTHPLKFEHEILTISKDYNFHPELIASLINAESSFNEKAKSNKGAIGLMQIKLTTANYVSSLNNENKINESELFSPSINIKIGCQYLKYLLNKFKNLDTALAAYNAGETRVREWLKSGIYSTDEIKLNFIPFIETREYVKKINKDIKFYKKYFKN